MVCQNGFGKHSGRRSTHDCLLTCAHIIRYASDECKQRPTVYKCVCVVCKSEQRVFVAELKPHIYIIYGLGIISAPDDDALDFTDRHCSCVRPTECHEPHDVIIGCLICAADGLQMFDVAARERGAHPLCSLTRTHLPQTWEDPEPARRRNPAWRPDPWPARRPIVLYACCCWCCSFIWNTGREGHRQKNTHARLFTECKIDLTLLA